MAERIEPRRIVERIRPPADPLQAAAKYDVHTLPRTWRARWYDMAPQMRMAVAVLAVAPLVLLCAMVAGMMAR